MYTGAILVHEDRDYVNVTIEELNEELWPLHVPAVLFIGICMVIGAIGNLFVFYIYKTKFRQTNHRYFILCLACLDFLACTMGMPYLIYSLRRPYLLQMDEACKGFRYCHYLVNNSSGLLLVVICIERFRKICRPFKRQLSSKETLILCFLTVGFSAIVAIPAPVFFGKSTVYTGIGNITGSQCYIDDNYVDSAYMEIYNIFLLLETIICTVVLAVIYTFVIRKVWKQDAFIESMKSLHRSSLKRNMVMENEISESYSTEDMLDGRNTNVQGTCQSLSIGPETLAGSRPQSLVVEKRPSLGNIKEQSFAARAMVVGRKLTKSPTLLSGKGAGKDSDLGYILSSKMEAKIGKKSRATRRITLMLFTITVVFMLAFYPHLILMVLTMELEGFLNKMSRTQVIVYQVFLRIFIINNVANPIIYYFCDTKFKREFRNIFKRCCKRHR